MHEYLYTIRDAWQPVSPALRTPRVPAYVTDSEDLADWLCEHGYKRMAQSGPGRCDVGHFYVWHQEERQLGDPLYAIEIDQLDAEGVVWIAALPDLWEFLRLYGQIGFTMARLLPGEEEAPLCPDCGEPMTPIVENDGPEYDA